MAQSVPPGDLKCDDDVIFNEGVYCQTVWVENVSSAQVGWQADGTSGLIVTPSSGILRPKGIAILAISCAAVKHGRMPIGTDLLTIEWTNTPDGAAKQFRREWFRDMRVVRRKNLPIEYNS